MYKFTIESKRRVASLAVRFASEIEHHPHPGRHLWISRVLGPTVHGRNDVRIRMRVRLERLFALRHRPLDRPRVSQSRVRFKRRAHAIPFIVKDASIDAPRQHRAKRVPATSPRASPRVSRRAHRARSGRVGYRTPPRIAPRRRPRLVAVVPDSSRIVRRTCTDESRARASSPSRSSLGSSPSAATASRRGGRGGGDSLTGHDSSYTRRSTARSNHSDRPARSNHATRESVTRARATRASIDATRYRASSARRSRTSSRDSIARASRGRHRRRRSVSVRPTALE